MRKSLSIKMLFLTLGSFLILISTIVISLLLYFNYFYEPQKINRIIDAINEFSISYENANWTDDQLYLEVSKFMKNQNATMSIVPSSGVAISAALPSASMSTLPSAALSTDIVLNRTQQSDFPLTNFNRGSLSFPVISYAMSTPLPTQAQTGVSSNVYGMATATSINGESVIYPVGTFTIASQYTTSLQFQSYEKKDVQYYLSNIPYTNFKQVDFIKKTTLKNGAIKSTCVNVSLQSVDEVTSILKHFFPFLIGLAILLSLVMVAIYSKIISKPIVAITNIANQMANMELGITSKIKRKDELGILSSSLNILSSNLKNALDDLVVANKQLKLDYESELRQDIARKEFVANVSHELKTPLGVIKSYSEGIRDGIKSEKKDYYIEVILDEINRMDHMIIEMLEMSKLDAGAVIYNKKPSNLQTLLDKTILFFDNGLQDKNITLETLGEFGTVLMDEEKIGRVLTNLIGNAIKYCASDSTVSIRGEQLGDKTKVSIENVCNPFSPEAHEKIWDRFYKVDTSHNRKIEGTGLGLSITKSILEGHDCSYGVENTNSGVCFYFIVG